jgi:hypothetical protein
MHANGVSMVYPKRQFLFLVQTFLLSPPVIKLLNTAASSRETQKKMPLSNEETNWKNSVGAFP